MSVHDKVFDREDAPIVAARLSFMHGIDRDQVGVVHTARDGSFAIAVPPGRLRIRVDAGALSSEIDAVVDGPCELDLVP